MPKPYASASAHAAQQVTGVVQHSEVAGSQLHKGRKKLLVLGSIHAHERKASSELPPVKFCPGVCKVAIFIVGIQAMLCVASVNRLTLCQLPAELLQAAAISQTAKHKVPIHTFIEPDSSPAAKHIIRAVVCTSSQIWLAVAQFLLIQSVGFRQTNLLSSCGQHKPCARC